MLMSTQLLMLIKILYASFYSFSFFSASYIINTTNNLCIKWLLQTHSHSRCQVIGSFIDPFIYGLARKFGHSTCRFHVPSKNFFWTIDQNKQWTAVGCANGYESL